MMRVSVLCPDIPGSRARSAEHSLAEAVSLAGALDLEIVHQTVVPLRKPQAGLLFGSGKLDKLDAIFKANDIGLVLVDGPLTPIQQRNLERHWDVKILDRTGLILEIFADRAQTREGVLQVDLAALSYQRTRLVRAWTHLERQRGGLSFVGGAGETQIEADRRAIDDAIVRLKRQLTKVEKTRGLHRAARKKVPFPIVALVGYTNAGKSTLFNRVTGSDVFAKDMVFATLDPTMRSLELPNGTKVILSDTVGFISELPTQLVAAFRATLEEVLDADLILHVRDIAHPESDEQARDVENILNELGVSQKAKTGMLEIWNKVDLLSNADQATLRNKSDRSETAFGISAHTGLGISELLAAIEEAISEPTTVEIVRIGFAEGGRRAELFDLGVVQSEVQTDYGFDVTVEWTKGQAGRFLKNDQRS